MTFYKCFRIIIDPNRFELQDTYLPVISVLLGDLNWEVVALLRWAYSKVIPCVELRLKSPTLSIQVWSGGGLAMAASTRWSGGMDPEVSRSRPSSLDPSPNVTPSPRVSVFWPLLTRTVSSTCPARSSLMVSSNWSSSSVTGQRKSGTSLLPLVPSGLGSMPLGCFFSLSWLVSSFHFPLSSAVAIHLWLFTPTLSRLGRTTSCLVTAAYVFPFFVWPPFCLSLSLPLSLSLSPLSLSRSLSRSLSPLSPLSLSRSPSLPPSLSLSPLSLSLSNSASL